MLAFEWPTFNFFIDYLYDLLINSKLIVDTNIYLNDFLKIYEIYSLYE